MGFNGKIWTTAQAKAGMKLLDAWMAKATAESAPIVDDEIEPEIMED